MKLPTIKNNKVFEPHSFAVLSGGASLMDRKKEFGGPDERMDGFLALHWHGAHDDGAGDHREIYKIIDIARKIKGGQFDIYFCSTNCLRQYLNYCVDELEKKMNEI
jgi:hypothetical protein